MSSYPLPFGFMEFTNTLCFDPPFIDAIIMKPLLAFHPINENVIYTQISNLTDSLAWYNCLVVQVH